MVITGFKPLEGNDRMEMDFFCSHRGWDWEQQPQATAGETEAGHEKECSDSEWSHAFEWVAQRHGGVSVPGGLQEQVGWTRAWDGIARDNLMWGKGLDVTL